MKLVKLFIILFTCITFAQESIVNGKINAVDEDGLYRIHIPHNIRSYTAFDLRDFRIWDTNRNQVPYFVQAATTYEKIEVSNFTDFEIVSSTRIADTSSTYVFKNPNKSIKKAAFLIANYQGTKKYRLEGSNDKKKWFGIVNNGNLRNLNNPTEPTVYKVINFPLCTYKYLKIVFNDSNSLPINLLKIGKAIIKKSEIVAIAMEEIPTKKITFSENNKKTEVHISFDRREVINQIKMVITAPDLYSRNATLYTLKERVVKHKKQTFRKKLASFPIRSDNELVFDISQFSESEIYLEIENNDNPKLQISDIHFLQKPIYLVASLKESEHYKITAGDTNLSLPNYDIKNVTNTSKSELPIVEISSVDYVKATKPIKEKVSFWQQSWFMWCCIGLAALMISYFAFNLLKDLDKNK